MKKRQLAQMQFELKRLSQMVEHNTEKLLEIIQQASSALATTDPELALGVIAQLNGNVPNIKALAAERAKDEADYIELVTKNLPDSLELEAEDN